MPVKLSPILKFLKELAVMVREKAEINFQNGQSVIKFPQIFYQAMILTTGIIDDIDDVMKILENT